MDWSGHNLSCCPDFDFVVVFSRLAFHVIGMDVPGKMH